MQQLRLLHPYSLCNNDTTSSYVLVMQSPDLRQTEPYARFMQSIGWQATTSQQTIQYSKKILPGFVTVKIQRSTSSIELSLVHRFQQEFSAGYCKLEPAVILEDASPQQLQLINQQILTAGFKPDSWPFLPSKTLKIDLTQPLSKLTKVFHTNARRNLKQTQQNKLSSNSNPQLFYRHWQQFAQAKHIPILSISEFQALQQSFNQNFHTINIVNTDNQWLAGVLLLKADRTAYYYQAASSQLGQQLRAPYIAVYESLLWAQKQGCQTFDFEGIADDRYPATNTLDWQGFGKFKQKFGGQVATYIGSYSYYWGWAKAIGWVESISKQFNL